MDVNLSNTTEMVGFAFGMAAILLVITLFVGFSSWIMDNYVSMVLFLGFFFSSIFCACLSFICFATIHGRGGKNEDGNKQETTD